MCFAYCFKCKKVLSEEEYGSHYPWEKYACLYCFNLVNPVGNDVLSIINRRKQ